MNIMVRTAKLNPEQDSGAHGRPTLKNMAEIWNKALQKEIEHTKPKTTDATAAFMASLEDPNLPRLDDTNKKPPIEIIPPGMTSISLSISAPKKPTPPTGPGSQHDPEKPLLLELPPTVTPTPDSNEPLAATCADSGQTGPPSGQQVSGDVPPSAESSKPEVPGPGTASNEPQTDVNKSNANQALDQTPTHSNQIPAAGLNQSRGRSLADLKRSQAFGPVGLKLDQSEALPSYGLNQSQGLTSPGLSQILTVSPTVVTKTQGLDSSESALMLDANPSEPPLVDFTGTEENNTTTTTATSSLFGDLDMLM